MLWRKWFMLFECVCSTCFKPEIYTNLPGRSQFESMLITGQCYSISLFSLFWYCGCCSNKFRNTWWQSSTIEHRNSLDLRSVSFFFRRGILQWERDVAALAICRSSASGNLAEYFPAIFCRRVVRAMSNLGRIISALTSKSFVIGQVALFVLHVSIYVTHILSSPPSTWSTIGAADSLHRAPPLDSSFQRFSFHAPNCGTSTFCGTYGTVPQ